jgi:hypothetical protein
MSENRNIMPTLQVLVHGEDVTRWVHSVTIPSDKAQTPSIDATPPLSTDGAEIWAELRGAKYLLWRDENV